jgi:hypothetical protein
MRLPAGSPAVTRSAKAAKSGASRAVLRAYQAAIRPSMPIPL